MENIEKFYLKAAIDMETKITEMIFKANVYRFYLMAGCIATEIGIWIFSNLVRRWIVKTSYQKLILLLGLILLTQVDQILSTLGLNIYEIVSSKHF